MLPRADYCSPETTEAGRFIFPLSSYLVQVAGIFQKGAHEHVWCPRFCGCCPEDATCSPGFGGQWGFCSRVSPDCNKQRNTFSLVIPPRPRVEGADWIDQSFYERRLLALLIAVARGDDYPPLHRLGRPVGATLMLSLCPALYCSCLWERRFCTHLPPGVLWLPLRGLAPVTSGPVFMGSMGW